MIYEAAETERDMSGKRVFDEPPIMLSSKKPKAEAKATATKAVCKPPCSSNFRVVPYSQYSIAVFGDTKPIKDRLIGLGGKFNGKLKLEGAVTPGWIFPKAKEEELQSLLDSLNVLSN